MSNLREKAREIKAAGEAERGDYTPSGVPLRLYNYWAEDRRDRLKPVPERENFCHYWRVVGIWAPMVAARNALTSNAAGWVYAIVGLAAVVAVIITGAVMKPVLYLYLLIAFVGLYLALGLIGGFAMSAEAYDEMDKEDKAFFKFFPQAWPTFVVGRGLQRVPEFVWMGLVGLLAAAVVVGLCVMLFSTIGWWALLVITGIPVATFAFLLFCTVIEDYVKGRRVKKAQAREEWRAKIANGEVVAHPDAKQGFVSRIFSGIADFVVLIAQVVRVNKWKICPIVTIDTKENDAVNA